MGLESLSRQWRAVGLDCLEWREWGGEFVVYNEVTASTHLLEPIMAAVLQLLCNEQCFIETNVLERRMFGENLEKMSNNTGAAFSLEPILTELERVGLVETSTP